MKYRKANQKYPNMGLNNKICIDPKYWCTLHEVWLSEEDIKMKRCRNKRTFDMLGTYRCRCLQTKEVKMNVL